VLAEISEPVLVKTAKQFATSVRTILGTEVLKESNFVDYSFTKERSSSSQKHLRDCPRPRIPQYVLEKCFSFGFVSFRFSHLKSIETDVDY
jgi:hypothetical protein